MHGGTSTVPRTQEGLQRIVKARTVHGATAPRCASCEADADADKEQQRVLELVKQERCRAC